MIYFLRGVIHQVNSDSVVIDVRDVGYEALVSHVSEYEVGQNVLLYILEAV